MSASVSLANLGAVLFICSMAVLAVGLAFGTYRRWEWLVDPATKAWPIYSQAFSKKFFGKRAVILSNYLVAAVMIAVAVASLLKIALAP